MLKVVKKPSPDNKDLIIKSPKNNLEKKKDYYLHYVSLFYYSVLLLKVEHSLSFLFSPLDPVVPLSVYPHFVLPYSPFPCTLLHCFAQSHWPSLTSWTLKFASLPVGKCWFACSFLIALSINVTKQFCF